MNWKNDTSLTIRSSRKGCSEAIMADYKKSSVHCHSTMCDGKNTLQDMACLLYTSNYHFEIGKGEQITEGNDIAIIATGLMVNEARIAAEQLAAEGIHARVINIHTIKPLDEEIVLKAAKECGKVITAEEHNVIGGLGEAVCAVLSEKLPTPVRRVGVQDVFGCSGPAWDLLAKYGLDAATICKLSLIHI